jgi:hypothetical protein
MPPVTALTPQQRETRNRFEELIRLMAPALDAVLWVGDRIARVAEPDDIEAVAPRSRGREIRSPIGGGPSPDYDEQATVG